MSLLGQENIFICNGTTGSALAPARATLEARTQSRQQGRQFHGTADEPKTRANPHRRRQRD